MIIAHDFPGLKMVFLNSRTYHDFPGPVVTLSDRQTERERLTPVSGTAEH